MSRFYSILRDQKNKFDFFIRQRFHWNRDGLQFKNQSKEGMFDHLSLAQQGDAQKLSAYLIEQYHLELFFQQSTRINFRENLFYLSMLENAFNKAGVIFGQTITVADIGPAHWFYVQALFAGLTWWNCEQSRQVNLNGFEIDAYRLFSNLYSSYDYARAHIRNLPVKYFPTAFLAQNETYDLITLFFPFVFLKDHQEWGLPNRSFDPEWLRKSVKKSLKPGGYVLVVNQGEQEHHQEMQYLINAHFRILCAFEQDDLLYQYDLKRYIMVAQHES